MKRSPILKLNSFIDELQSAIGDKDLMSESVSSVNIAWQIEHSLLVLNAVSNTLRSSEPSDFKKKFNLLKLVLFTVRRFPRGKAQSPKSVRPKSELTKEELENLAETVRDNVSKLSALESGKFFKHPMFGNLRLKDSIRFLELHTEHHLRIIRSIQKAN